ncbi:MAG TPA: DUF1801 domain-containing protein [Fimbriimonadaceae bacterium]
MPESVEEYLRTLPRDRRESMEAVRATILKHLPKDYEEGVLYGGVGYYVPHSVYPAGYHCDPKIPLPLAVLTSKKNYMSLHLMTIYGNEEMRSWFEDAYAKAGKKLDMGKACLNFKKAEELPLEVIGQAIARVSAKDYIAKVQEAIGRKKK